MLTACLLLAACGRSAPPDPSVLQQRQVALDRIADRCGAPRSAFKLIDRDHVSLQPVVDLSDQHANCLIKELSESKLPVKLGFISEPPPEENGVERFEVTAYESQAGPERVAEELIIPDARTRIPALLKACGVFGFRPVDATDGVLLFQFVAPAKSSELQCVRQALPKGAQLRGATLP